MQDVHQAVMRERPHTITHSALAREHHALGGGDARRISGYRDALGTDML